MMSLEDLTRRTFDVIVAAGGAAGCVLAGRLSESSQRRILLIEAGPDAPPGEEHPDIRNPFPVASDNPRFTWSNIKAQAGAVPEDGSDPAATFYRQGYGIGGGSNINGMGADRGHPADFDEWQTLGASGWDWSGVLPYFNKAESDQD